MTKMTDTFVFPSGLELKNRTVLAPMTNYMSFFDGTVTTDELNYYRMRSGEIGAVITAAANVQPDGQIAGGQWGIYDDKFIPSLAKVASAIKKNGTKAILQLFHAGRMTNSAVLGGTQIVAPSAVAAERPDAQIPREITSEEVLQLIENFKLATERAMKAGFDGVEFHGGNTYMIQQFFSPHSNRREDEWGGSLENRFKFVEKLVDAVIDFVEQSGKKEFIVGYRFSPEEYETPGISLEDTLYLVDKLSDKKIDYLHISLGNYDKVSISDDYKEKSIIEYINEKIAGRVPFIGVGDVRTKKDVEKVLDNADLVAIGRAMLFDPHWVSKTIDGHEELIRRELNRYDTEELIISEGIWGNLEDTTPERLK
uniref:NADH-dependent flavin oxidoreductase n=1 Tax=Carnobacterium TaxID=2747 RepID=UPI00344C4232